MLNKHKKSNFASWDVPHIPYQKRAAGGVKIYYEQCECERSYPCGYMKKVGVANGFSLIVAALLEIVRSVLIANWKNTRASQ